MNASKGEETLIDMGRNFIYTKKWFRVLISCFQWSRGRHIPVDKDY